jgi:hypothetical protein
VEGPQVRIVACDVFLHEKRISKLIRHRVCEHRFAALENERLAGAVKEPQEDWRVLPAEFDLGL